MSWLSAMLGPLAHPAPLPIHLLGGGPLTAAAARGALWLAHGLKLAAVPAVVLLAPADRQLTMAVAVVGLVAGLALLRLRRPRSCAEPLRDEALFLGGLAVLAATELSLTHAAGSLVGGGLLTLLVASGIGGLIFLNWGRQPRFVEMRRPTFRILGDNPDALAAIVRVRVAPRRPQVITIPHVARGPITLAVNRPNMQVHTSVPWRDLVGPLEARGEVTVALSAPDESTEPTDFSIDVPPGRYIVSVRYYRPFDRERLPSIRRAEAA